MSSYANVNYDDVKHLAHIVGINEVTYTTELLFEGPKCGGVFEGSISGDLYVSHHIADGAIEAHVSFPFSRDRERRNLLVDWFVENGIMFNVVT